MWSLAFVSWKIFGYSFNFCACDGSVEIFYFFLVQFWKVVLFEEKASGPITSWQIDGETVETVADFMLGAPKSLQMVIAAMKLKDVCSLEGKLRPT